MIGKYALRFFSLGYLAVLLVAPVGYVFWKAFEHGVGPAWDAVTTPDALHALKVTLILTAIAVPANTIFGVSCAIAIVRHRFPGAGIVNAARRPPARAVACGRRAGAAVALRPGRLARRAWDRLRSARDGAGDDLRLVAVRRARGRAGVARDRDGAGTGGGDARRVGAARLSPSHVAGDPLCDRLRHGTDHGPLPRRVRRGERRLRQAGRARRSHSRSTSRIGTSRSTSPAPMLPRWSSRCSPWRPCS